MTAADEAELNRLLPHWHFREMHSLTVPAPHEAVMAAVFETTWAEAPLARAVMAVTGADVSADRRIVTDSLSAMGEVMPSGEGEFVFVGLDSMDDGPRPEGTTAELVAAYEGPGVVKIGMNIRFAEGTLSTETRVLATDEQTRRRFRRYWRIIRLGSGLTRMSTLRAIRSRALARPGRT
ncbi:hypothetical protein ACWGHM_05520 [Streptomyces sp. NPDC054904]